MGGGKLIVIEGSDSSGKATQASLLLPRMREHGLVMPFAFPRYDTPSGMFVRECLSGKFGNFLEESPYFASLPYILDFVNAKEEMRDALSRGHVLSDRYSPSNIAHQGAKLHSRKAQRAFIGWLEEYMYDVYDLPKPDAVVYLRVPIAVSLRLMKERGGKKDQHEAALDYQDAVIETYTELASERLDWHIVECAPNDRLLSREAIHEKVWTIVAPLL